MAAISNFVLFFLGYKAKKSRWTLTEKIFAERKFEFRVCFFFLFENFLFPGEIRSI